MRFRVNDVTTISGVLLFVYSSVQLVARCTGLALHCDAGVKGSLPSLFILILIRLCWMDPHAMGLFGRGNWLVSFS